MRKNYTAGGWGYGHTKKAILDKILTDFAAERKRFDYFISNKTEIDKVLQDGAVKARKVARNVVERVRAKLGYGALNQFQIFSLTEEKMSQNTCTKNQPIKKLAAAKPLSLLESTAILMAKHECKWIATMCSR